MRQKFNAELLARPAPPPHTNKNSPKTYSLLRQHKKHRNQQPTTLRGHYIQHHQIISNPSFDTDPFESPPMSEQGADLYISLICFESNPLLWILIRFHFQPGGGFWSKKMSITSNNHPPSNTFNDGCCKVSHRGMLGFLA